MGFSGGRLLVLLALSVGASVVAGCVPGRKDVAGEVDPDPQCTDQDGDGYGVGRDCAGTDCDDEDPEVWDPADCEVTCADDPEAPGCPCDQAENPEPEFCYTGPPETLGVGTCRGGMQVCEEGVWSECRLEVVPNDGDRCGDFLDDDCDGVSDQGCDERCDGEPQCEGEGVPGEDGWNEDAMDGLDEREDGALVLQSSGTRTVYAWIANTVEGTVSKVDTIERVEVARYPAVMEIEVGAPALDEPCNYSNRGNCPSRSAVAPNGDAFVANRAFGRQATVTKFAGDIDRCVDRDRDGIETSVDLDHDGAISLAPEDGEYLGLDDECVLWTVPVGGVGNLARALTIAPAIEPGETGELWVGLHQARRAIVLDPETGEQLDDIPLEVNTYGAVASGDGRIWFGDAGTLGGEIQAVDVWTHEPEPVVIPAVPADVDCVGGYGIAIDEHNRVWRASYPCFGAFRYDPEDEEWVHFPIPGVGVSLGITPDGEGGIWVGFYQDEARRAVESLVRIDAETGEIDIDVDIDPLIEDARGVGIDGEGQVWVVGRLSDNVIEYDPETEDIVSVPVGDEPYTYSDFTGFILNRLVQPTGYYDHVFEGCEGDVTRWYDVEVEADVPAGTSVEVSLRTADTVVGLAAAEWNGPFDPPADARALRGRFLGVRVWLRASAAGASPALFGLSAAHSCGPGIE